MASTYVTADQVAEDVGEAYLRAAAPDPGAHPPSWSRPAVERAIEAVSEEIDARLANAYALPLDDVPRYLRRVASRLVHAELVDSATTTDLIQSRARDARRTLDLIAHGKIRIGADDRDGDGRTNARTRQGRAILTLPPGAARRRRDLRGLV